MLRSLSRWTPTFAILAGIAYFAGHALTGQNGLFAWSVDRARIAALELDLDDLQLERLALEDRAARLRDETLDLDYLDERARALVGVGNPRDIVVPGGARQQARESRR
jgi:cell division protein FtsB